MKQSDNALDARTLYLLSEEALANRYAETTMETTDKLSLWILKSVRIFEQGYIEISVADEKRSFEYALGCEDDYILLDLIFCM